MWQKGAGKKKVSDKCVAENLLEDRELLRLHGGDNYEAWFGANWDVTLTPLLLKLQFLCLVSVFVSSMTEHFGVAVDAAMIETERTVGF